MDIKMNTIEYVELLKIVHVFRKVALSRKQKAIANKYAEVILDLLSCCTTSWSNTVELSLKSDEFRNALYVLTNSYVQFTQEACADENEYHKAISLRSYFI